MILAGTAVRKALVTALSPVLDPIPVNSIKEPNEDLVYVMITSLSEIETGGKDCFQTEGFMQINIYEKFIGRDGNYDEVSRVANLISQTLTPTKLSSLGDLEGVNVFYINIESNAENLFETDPGRTAVSSLRLRYLAQKGTLVT